MACIIQLHPCVRPHPQCLSISLKVSLWLDICLLMTLQLLSSSMKSELSLSAFPSLFACLPPSFSLCLCNMISIAVEPLCAAEQFPPTCSAAVELVAHDRKQSCCAVGAGAAHSCVMLSTDLQVLSWAAAQFAGCPTKIQHFTSVIRVRKLLFHNSTKEC